MKRATMLVVMLALAIFGWAQDKAPAAQSAPAQAAPAQPPVGKRPPQAKTQAEFDAYKVAAANTAENMMEMGRKVLKLDPDDPEALVGVAQVLAERTRESDLDKDQRLDEGTKLALHAVETADTDITVPPGTPQDKVDEYKGFLRSTAYYVLGTIQYTKEKYSEAEGYFRKSIEALPSQPDPLAVLRLALSLDKQEKYPEALKFANQAVQMTESNQASTLPVYLAMSATG